MRAFFMPAKPGRFDLVDTLFTLKAIFVKTNDERARIISAVCRTMLADQRNQD